ncbi:hypothetical protein [Streptomyces sp. NBC_01198]|uniref:hypothetical protein n=1 Tax=Streptomyces sp. NBC_01198 TaxID=2903769 RepID=UPI002E151320|nr:hypothetical protein OG702_03415 [Streptomyces sp. NBC_01198]
MTTPVKNRPATERVPAGPARKPRPPVSIVLAPLFLITSGLLAWWASDSGPDGSASLGLLAGVSAVLFVVTAVHTAILMYRARRGPAESDQAGPPGSR